MSEKFELVKSYYEKGLWNEEKVHNAIGKWITQEEYRLIVGQTIEDQINEILK